MNIVVAVGIIIDLNVVLAVILIVVHDNTVVMVVISN